jgi:alkanesulfonate monooxygenase
LRLFSTCPQSATSGQSTYRRDVVQVAQWSERAGCAGILVYTDNSIVDPWLVSQIIVESTQQLCPLVAVQPVYMSPYSVAKMVTTFGYLYQRRLYLNMVAGGFKNDLVALNDLVPHDRRYDRLIEYTTIISKLLKSSGAVTFEGEFYSTKNLSLKPPLAAELFPGLMVSGSSAAGLAAAHALDAIAVKYPEPPVQGLTWTDGTECGIRVGIIARADRDEAWAVAHDRFPSDRKGQVMHQMAMKVSDSAWHKQLSGVAEELEGREDTYWLVPFENYKTNCPYLVGDYEEVATYLMQYLKMGVSTVILDIPPTEEELHHIGITIRAAQVC